MSYINSRPLGLTTWATVVSRDIPLESVGLFSGFAGIPGSSPKPLFVTPAPDAPDRVFPSLSKTLSVRKMAKSIQIGTQRRHLQINKYRQGFASGGTRRPKDGYI